MKSWSTVITVTIKYILGPILAALLGVGVAKYGQDKAAKGYEVLAKALNDQVLARLNHIDQRLDTIEVRLDKLEQRAAAASQPINISRIILPGAASDPYEDIRRAMKTVPRPGTVSTKVMVKAAPTPPAPPARAPLRKSAPEQLVPPRF